MILFRKNQAAEIKALGNARLAILARGDDQRLRQIGHSEDRDTVAVKRRGIVDLRGDHHAFLIGHFRVEGYVMTALFLNISGEARIIRHVLQRTRNGSILVKSNTGLKIAGRFAKQILITGVRRYS